MGQVPIIWRVVLDVDGSGSHHPHVKRTETKIQQKVKKKAQWVKSKSQNFPSSAFSPAKFGRDNVPSPPN